MTRTLHDKSMPGMALAALSSALILGWAGAAQAADPPEMTILIYNNSCLPGACKRDEMPYNIYPVLSTGTSTPDLYMQAILKVPLDKVGDKPYPKTNQFRFYMNPTGRGIAPGGSIKLTLPFYTQLVATDKVNPKDPDQYIDWWGGGRIEIFDAPASIGRPSPALTADYVGTNLPAREKQVKVTPLPGAALPKLVDCKPDPCQPLTIFKDPAGLTNNEPSQLTEYTLGALKLAVKTPSDPYGLDLHNVDYDVSYVDATYLPAAMEPYNNKQVGYVGTISSIYDFRLALAKYLTNKKGWPQFLDDQKLEILKIPSPVNIFAGLTNPTPRADLATKPPWLPFTTLTTNWNLCIDQNKQTPICSNMRDVRALLAANFQWCFGRGPSSPSDAAYVLARVYGWSPFNTELGSTAACPNLPGAAHLLEDTQGYYKQKDKRCQAIDPSPVCCPQNKANCDYSPYQAVKAKFDELQYWPSAANPNGEFDPYLLLIHGKDYINTDRAYAYSVDDALGNMQVAGDGLIIAVGGAGGLPNPNPATPPINIQFGYASTDLIKFTRYGICTLAPDRDVDPTFTSFAISSTNPQNCPISFVDDRGTKYTFMLRGEPPYPIGPPPGDVNIPDRYYPSLIDCSGNRPDSAAFREWCRTPVTGTPVDYGVYVYTEKGAGGAKTNKNYAVTRPAVQNQR